MKIKKKFKIKKNPELIHFRVHKFCVNYVPGQIISRSNLFEAQQSSVSIKF